MIDLTPNLLSERDDARAGVREILLRLEDEVRGRRGLRGPLLDEYARRVARLRWCEARLWAGA